jgi:hypothetical protein
MLFFFKALHMLRCWLYPKKEKEKQNKQEENKKKKKEKSPMKRMLSFY